MVLSDNTNVDDLTNLLFARKDHQLLEYAYVEHSQSLEYVVRVSIVVDRSLREDFQLSDYFSRSILV